MMLFKELDDDVNDEINDEEGEVSEEVFDEDLEDQVDDFDEGENELVKQIEKLENELASLKDQNLRIRAEFDNFRKRTAKEKQSLYDDSQIDCVLEFLPVLDGLEKAFVAVDGQNDDLSSGVRLILDQFVGALKKLGVESVAKKGEPFNPKFHSAVKTVEVDEFGRNCVYEVLQKGYCKGDRVVRHAVVVVANP